MPASTQVDFSGLEINGAALDAQYGDVFARDLAPYNEDNAFLLRRMSSGNRLLRKAPEFVTQIQEALMGDDDDSLVHLADDLEIARQLYAPEGEKPINTVLSHMNLLENINSIRIDLGAQEHTGPRVNALNELIAVNTARAFPEELLDDAWHSANFIMERTQEIYDKVAEREAAKVRKLRFCRQ